MCVLLLGRGVFAQRRDGVGRSGAVFGGSGRRGRQLAHEVRKVCCCRIAVTSRKWVPRRFPVCRQRATHLTSLSMNVFVTGGAGYIGSVYVEEALNAGHRVTVYDNLSEGHRAAIDPRAAFVPADLAEDAR